MPPVLHERFDDWTRDVERTLRAEGLAASKLKAKAIRIMVRRLLADEELQNEVIGKIRGEAKK